jgi:WhiB family redox-sensing transcriptional regulator
MITIPMPDWYESAVCASVGDDYWYPEKGGTPRHAKKVCAECPVASLCLEWALDNGERWGIWGGKSDKERRALGARRRCRNCDRPFTLGDNPGDRMCSEECRRTSRIKTVETQDKTLGCIQCGAKSTALRCRDCQHRWNASQVMTRAQTKDAA